MKNSNFEEANEINNAINEMISERQSIDAGRNDFLQETWLLGVSLDIENYCRGSRSNDVKNHAKRLIHCLY